MNFSNYRLEANEATLTNLNHPVIVPCQAQEELEQ